MVLLKYQAIHDTPLIETLHQRWSGSITSPTSPTSILSFTLRFSSTYQAFSHHRTFALIVPSAWNSLPPPPPPRHISTWLTPSSHKLWSNVTFQGGFPWHTYQSMSCQENRNHCFKQRKFNSGNCLHRWWNCWGAKQGRLWDNSDIRISRSCCHP